MNLVVRLATGNFPEIPMKYCTRSSAGNIPIGVIAVLLLLGGPAGAKDGFESVRCDLDIAKALLGKQMSNEPVAKIEQRHKELGLKDLGGDEISDRLNLTSWQICGREYQVLSDSRDLVVDVLAFPSHARTSPEFIGICQVNGKKFSQTVIAVLDDQRAMGSKTDRTLLPARTAWRIDGARARFLPLPSAGLECPRDGIITADGGP